MTSKLLQTLVLLIAAPFLLLGSMVGLVLSCTGHTVQAVRKVWHV